VNAVLNFVKEITEDSSSSEAVMKAAVGVVGDLGQTDDSVDTARQIDADPDLRLIIHPGDMSYADTNATKWDRYDTLMEPLSSRLQWMVVPGNHEIESDAITGANFVPYEARFNMPRIKPPVNKPTLSQEGCLHVWPPISTPRPDCTPSIFTKGVYDWGNSFYAYDAGPARVIALNSYTSTEPGSPQYDFLQRELETLKSRRAETPWLIIQMHCPYYNSNKKHQDEAQTIALKANFEDLFYENHVALILTGHVHAYERTHPVYRNETKPGAPTYVVIGDGGNREGHCPDYLEKPSWSAFRNGTSYGHGKITLLNASHMRWDWMVDDPAVLTHNLETAGKHADRHARSGAVAAGPTDSPWRRPLAGRRVEDTVYVTNPWTQSEAQVVV